MAEALAVTVSSRATCCAALHSSTPTQSDWECLARDWQRMLDERLALLMRLREQLGNCIGRGRLCLKRCALYNPPDQAAVGGSGVRYWLGQRPPV